MTEKMPQEASSPASDPKGATRHDEAFNASLPSAAGAEQARQNLNARLANPLAGYSRHELEEMGAAYARKYKVGDEEDVEAFRQGAVCAQDPFRFDSYDGLSAIDKEIMRKEFSNKWAQPWLMYLVIVLCSVCAAVQGMGELPAPTDAEPRLRVCVRDIEKHWLTLVHRCPMDRRDRRQWRPALLR